jgi:hypothetical protein
MNQYLKMIAPTMVVSLRLLIIVLALEGCSLLPTPIPTPRALITPKPFTTPDPRIAQFESVGIHLLDQRCAAPCSSDVIPYVKLSEFIEKVGAPEKVYSSFGSPPIFYVLLVYTTKGYIATAYRPLENNITDMTPDMLVGRIDLWNARNLNDLKREIREVEKLDLPLERAQDWTGFGPVKPLR